MEVNGENKDCLESRHVPERGRDGARFRIVLERELGHVVHPTKRGGQRAIDLIVVQQEPAQAAEVADPVWYRS